MCKAYTLTRPSAEIINKFDLQGDSEFTPRFNIRPGQLVPVIIQAEPRGLSFFYWGATPAFSKNKAIAEKLYNIRIESISNTALYRSAIEQRKCLVPADGFYAWRKISKKGLVPYRYFQENGDLFAFAGLWEEFEDDNGAIVHTFSIITTIANELVSQSDSRMPVIFDIEGGLQWLKRSGDEAIAMLKSYPAEEMKGFAVSNRVNNPEFDDPSLIEPAPPADQFGNYSLFN